MTDAQQPLPNALSAETGTNALNQMFEMYIGPEIQRRQAAGLIPTPYNLTLAQVLFPPDSTHIRVLLNDEVGGEALWRANRQINAGDPILGSDLAGIEVYDLSDNMLDNGHFTIIRAEEGWRIFFNFLYGRARARDWLQHASQFLAASIMSAQAGYSGPSIDSLFGAAELAAKAELILLRLPGATAGTHRSVHSALNRWSQTGNVDRAFVDTFNRLSQQRPNARYGDAEHRPPAPTQGDFEIIRLFIERGLERVARRTDHARDGEIR